LGAKPDREHGGNQLYDAPHVSFSRNHSEFHDAHDFDPARLSHNFPLPASR
jgi:hypothetical protein